MKVRSFRAILNSENRDLRLRKERIVRVIKETVYREWTKIRHISEDR